MSVSLTGCGVLRPLGWAQNDERPPSLEGWAAVGAFDGMAS